MRIKICLTREKTEITALKCREKATKSQKKVRKNVLVRSEKNWKKVPKVRKNIIFGKSEKIGNRVWQLGVWRGQKFKKKTMGGGTIWHTGVPCDIIAGHFNHSVTIFKRKIMLTFSNY